MSSPIRPDQCLKLLLRILPILRLDIGIIIIRAGWPTSSTTDGSSSTTTAAAAAVLRAITTTVILDMVRT